jgi:two-component system, chemotaxis family, sensor kinase Cph1
VSSSATRGLADPNTDTLQAHCRGTAQAHGLMLVVREPQLRVVQVSTNAAAMLGRPLDSLLLATLHDLGGDLEAVLRARLTTTTEDDAQALRCTLGQGDAAQAFEGTVHRVGDDCWLVELEPLGAARTVHTADLPSRELLERLGADVQALITSESVPELATAVATRVRALLGHQRVVVYELLPAAPGKVVAEARETGCASLLGEVLPWLEPPPAGWAEHLRQRVQVLADAGATPCELVPQMLLGPEGAVDLSRGLLRGVPSSRCEALLKQGVQASLCAAIVREGRLWGLVAALHDQPRHVGPALRAAVDLLAEVMATRIAAIESYARSQVAAQVQLLEQSMLEATSADGDWRRALFQDPETLLRPLAATGAVLCHEGELQRCGDVPPDRELHALLQWLDARTPGTPWHCASVAAIDPTLAAMTTTACGALCVRLSAAPRHLLVWLRQPQRAARTPLQPASAAPWTGHEVALAAALGHAVADLIVQVNAVRMLITENQLSRLRTTVAKAEEAVVIVADGTPAAFYANEAFYLMAGRGRDECSTLEALARLCTDTALAQRVIGHVRAEQRAWQGEWALRRAAPRRRQRAAGGRAGQARAGARRRPARRHLHLPGPECQQVRRGGAHAPGSRAHARRPCRQGARRPGPGGRDHRQRQPGRHGHCGKRRHPCGHAAAAGGAGLHRTRHGAVRAHPHAGGLSRPGRPAVRQCARRPASRAQVRAGPPPRPAPCSGAAKPGGPW